MRILTRLGSLRVEWCTNKTSNAVGSSVSCVLSQTLWQNWGRTRRSATAAALNLCLLRSVENQPKENFRFTCIPLRTMTFPTFVPPIFVCCFFCLRGGGRSSSTYVTHMEWFSRGPALDSRQMCVRAADVNGRVTLYTTPRFPEGSMLLVLPLVVCWPDSTADKGKDMKECDSHSSHFMSWLWSKQNKF